MPLYGSKLFQTNPPSPVKTENGAENTVYEIDFTGEKFTDQAIYEETLKLYNERVWTDRCTGEGSKKSSLEMISIATASKIATVTATETTTATETNQKNIIAAKTKPTAIENFSNNNNNSNNALGCF